MRANDGAPGQAVSEQPSAQTPDRSLFSTVGRNSVIDSSPTDGGPAPQIRGKRLPQKEGAKENRSSQDEKKTAGDPGPTRPIAALSIVSGALVPAVPTGVPFGPSKPTNSGEGPVHNVATRISEVPDSQVHAPAGEQPAEDPGASAAVANSSTAGTVQNAPEALAFAVRLQPAKTAPLPSRVSAGQPASDNSAATGADDASSPAHAAKQKLESDADPGGSSADDVPKDAEKSKATSEIPTQNFSPADGSMAARIGSSSLEASSQPAAEPRQPGSQPSTPAARIAESPSIPQTTASQGPVKEISMRLEAAEGQKVDVRIVQRAGDLQIAVKSADDVTTQGLRHGLSDLANRLNETGYQAETWRPGHQAATESSNTSSEDPSHQSQSDGSQSNSGGPQQDRGQRQNNPSNRPHWIDELESTLSGGPKPTGQLNGIVSQPTI